MRKEANEIQADRKTERGEVRVLTCCGGHGLLQMSEESRGSREDEDRKARKLWQKRAEREKEEEEEGEKGRRRRRRRRRRKAATQISDRSDYVYMFHTFANECVFFSLTFFYLNFLTRMVFIILLGCLPYANANARMVPM